MTTPVFEIHPGLSLKGQLSTTKDIILTGKFEGDLQTRGCLTVAPGGVVVGSIDAGALVLEPGNLVEAKVRVGASPRAFLAEEAGRKTSGGKWTGHFQKLKKLVGNKSP